MFDIIKKSILAGIGAIAATQEKAQDVIADFVEKGKITEQEGKTLLNDLQHAVQENQEKFSAKIDERVTCMMDRLNLATKDDLAAVNERLARIEQQLQALKTPPQG